MIYPTDLLYPSPAPHFFPGMATYKLKLLIVLLMMGILVPETCWGNKTAYFVASSWFLTFAVSTMHGHYDARSQEHKSPVGLCGLGNRNVLAD
jgi:hypothetical protein